MTLNDFETSLRRFIPDLRIRQKPEGNITSVYVRNDYLIRINQGELNLQSYRRPDLMSDKHKKENQKKVALLSLVEARNNIISGKLKMSSKEERELNKVIDETIENIELNPHHGSRYQLYKGPQCRGRMEALRMLVNMRWLNSYQAQQVLWGVYE